MSLKRLPHRATKTQGREDETAAAPRSKKKGSVQIVLTQSFGTRWLVFLLGYAQYAQQRVEVALVDAERN